MSMLIISVSMTWAPTVALAGFFGNSDQEIIDSGGTVSEVAPDWRIFCFSEGQDVFGGVSAHKHCRIDNRDVRGITVITAEGLSIPFLPSRPACGGYNGSIKVDGKAIDNKPLNEEIKAMSHGITFSRPYQTPWSECSKFTQFTGLYGFSAALSRLKSQWRKFK